jgi:hypothetical protein
VHALHDAHTKRPASISRAVAPIVPGRPGSSVVERPVKWPVAPALASSMAVPLPIPRMAPVTSAMMPSSGACLRTRSSAIARTLASQ